MVQAPGYIVRCLLGKRAGVWHDVSDMVFGLGFVGLLGRCVWVEPLVQNVMLTAEDYQSFTTT